MDNIMTKQKNAFIAPILFLVLMFGVGISNVEASSVPATTTNATQVAWWGHYYGRFHTGYYYPHRYYGGYYYRPYVGARCQNYCWRNQWNRVQCRTRCYY